MRLKLFFGKWTCVPGMLRVLIVCVVIISFHFSFDLELYEAQTTHDMREAIYRLTRVRFPPRPSKDEMFTRPARCPPSGSRFWA